MYLRVGPNKRLVAQGNLYKLVFNHGRPLTPGTVKVRIFIPYEPDATLPFPVDEATTVGTASGNILEWPQDLVELGPGPEVPVKVKFNIYNTFSFFNI